jgi:hypothetical protein
MAEGEAPERGWSEIRHVIPSLRVSSSRFRLNTLTHIMVWIGEQRNHNFPVTLKKALCQMMKRFDVAEATLQTYCSANGVTLEYVQSQSESMRAYFLNTTPAHAQIEDDICEHLMAIEDMELFGRAVTEVTKACGSAWTHLKLNISLRTDGRIHQGLDNDIPALRNSVEALMEKANQSWDDWAKGGDTMLLSEAEKMPLYEKTHQRIHLSSLRRMKLAIKQELTNRKMELIRLHASSTVGQTSLVVMSN